MKMLLTTELQKIAELFSRFSIDICFQMMPKHLAYDSNIRNKNPTIKRNLKKLILTFKCSCCIMTTFKVCFHLTINIYQLPDAYLSAKCYVLPNDSCLK